MGNDSRGNRLNAVVTRRGVLRTLGAAVVAVPLGQLLACAVDEVAGQTLTDGGIGTDAGTTLDETADAGTPADAGIASDPSAWATGGTASMQGGYADPFASGLGSVCSLTCAATIGPCYATTVERQDISEGEDGLPVRLAFLVVDESCQPIEGATVDIWHAGPAGLYSGSDASDFCTSGDATARAARWFRGVQTTDANGRVDFDTCFPGWYSSRTIHIHFTIRLNGTEYVTSQLVFDDALDDEIVSTQPLYNARGKRDTSNSTDTVVSAESAKEAMFQTQQMSDGAMLAWKTLIVRSSTAESLCELAGGMGGPQGGDGGMMGPPPGGDGGMKGPPPGGDGGPPPPP